MASNGLSSTPLPSLLKHLREDNITRECKDLLPTLQSEKGWLIPRIYLYHGYWFSPAHLNGCLSFRKNFQPRDDDVIFVNLPKSGTTWMKAILFALSHRARLSTGKEDSSQLPNPLLTKNPHDLVPYLEINLYSENENPDLSSLASPRIFATHIPEALLPQCIWESKCKVVYLCRNIKDIFTSFWHFINNLGRVQSRENTLEEEFDRFCRGLVPFGPHWDHALGYWKASLEIPEKVLFLNYEDLKTRPVENVKRLAEFIGCPFDEDEDKDKAANEILRMCSFENLSNLEVNKSGRLTWGGENKAFFRKGEVGDWMNLITPEMANWLDLISEEKLRGSGLKL